MKAISVRASSQLQSEQGRRLLKYDRIWSNRAPKEIIFQLENKKAATEEGI